MFVICLALSCCLTMLLGSVALNYAMTMTAVEVLPNNTGSALAANRTVTHDVYNKSGNYNAGTTPPVSQVAEFVATLVAGTLTIDTTALVSTNGATLNATGLKLQFLRISNLGANDMTIAQGGSNGIAIGTGLLVCQGGDTGMFLNGSLVAIDATHKNLLLTGTGSQTANVTLIFG